MSSARVNLISVCGQAFLLDTSIVRYERRKQDRTFPVPCESYVLLSQDNAFRHEERLCGCTAAPCNP